MKPPLKLSLKLPPSFSALLLAGFVLVALPLLGGIFGMTHALEQMAFEGRNSVNISAKITQTSRQLSEVGLALKRAAGQYFVLEDPALKQRLERAHQSFQETLATLASMPWAPEQKARRFEALSAMELALYSRLEQAPATGSFSDYKDDFDDLDAAIAALSDDATQIIEQQVTGMNETAERIQAAMITLAATMVLLSLLLSGVLSWLLSRPVSQLAATIHRLGQNDLDTPSRIRGPGDLVYLGEQLDWLRNRLQELEERKLSFFREVSHELKTPLTNLMEAEGLLRDEVTGPLTVQQREVVEIMCSSTRDLRQRIEDLLSYNEVLNKPRLDPSWFELRSLVDEVTKHFDLSRRRKRLSWQHTLPSLRLYADRGRLAIALENLIGNAIRFSPNDGRIEISSRQQSNNIEIMVCDQGPGIPMELVDQLFQPFFKATPQPRGTLKGSGLGLAIARAYVELQGGQLILLPGNKRGTCFQITLPITQESPHCD